MGLKKPNLKIGLIYNFMKLIFFNEKQFEEKL
jgi:hypothetical protein